MELILVAWAYKKTRKSEKYKRDAQVCVAIISEVILQRNVGQYSIEHYYTPVVDFKDKDKITRHKFGPKDIEKSYSSFISREDVGKNVLLIKVKNSYILRPLLPLRNS